MYYMYIYMLCISCEYIYIYILYVYLCILFDCRITVKFNVNNTIEDSLMNMQEKDELNQAEDSPPVL